MKCSRPSVWLAHGLLLASCGGGGAASAPEVPAPAPIPASAPASSPTALQRPEDHQLVWADEFEQPGLPDAGRWAYDTFRNREGWFNRELQYYAAARADNSLVRDGRLVLAARRETLADRPDWSGQRYSSARLITRGKAEWTYGFFEIRAKLPCGRGTWPAIWLLAAQGDWPDAGELDLMEHLGREPGRVFSTVHTRSGFASQGKGGATLLPTACSAFHSYQMLWTPQSVRFGIDGVEHARYDNAGSGSAQWPFDKPQFLLLNIAVGGDLGGAVDDSAFPQLMEVEYVRVYQRRP